MKRTTLILSVALALSVAANMLLAGLIFGHRWGGDRSLGPAGAARFLERSLGALPEELRPAVRERLRGEMGEELRRMRQAHRAANEALRARPFDPDAAARALADLRGRMDSAQARLHTAVVATMAEAQAAGTLPPPPERRERQPRGEGDRDVRHGREGAEPVPPRP